MSGFNKRKPQAEFCTNPGCHEATSNGKIYCSAHVLLMPYAAKIAAIVEVRISTGVKEEADPFLEKKKRQPSAGRTYPPVFRRQA